MGQTEYVTLSLTVVIFCIKGRRSYEAEYLTEADDALQRGFDWFSSLPFECDWSVSTKQNGGLAKYCPSWISILAEL